MKVTYSYTEKGNGAHNEDVAGSFANVAWVIDGATPLFPNHPITGDNDVVWIVQQLQDCLPNFINDSDTLATIITDALQFVREEAFKLNPNLDCSNAYELPTFTIAMVRWANQKLEYYVLGDSGIFVKSQGKVSYFTDQRLDRFSQQQEVVMKEIKASTLDPDEKESKMLDTLQQTRKLLNTPEGYSIGSLDAKGIPHGYTGNVPLDDGAKVLCFSDGFARLFELYHATDWKMIELDVGSIKDYIDQIRQIETNDHTCTKYPRAKQQDDLTVMLIEN
ncbi:protein phosphatase 2C domain-containing protein [Aquibacillus sediminis]|uniref:protein phosphatase 2C domain-containing protein n=1 Tax=Aquibacillus sediminis TaxID=2574734 RepID=UPI001107B20C|nr:protein phosphatase 2C domain-containing protein [Aquibacillus sediminis]